MRTSAILAAHLVILSLATSQAADPAPTPTPTPTSTPAPLPEHIRKLHGFWKPESVKFDGKEQLADAKTKEMLTLAVINSEYRMYFSPDTDPDKTKRKYTRLFTADLTLDPATKTFELSVTDGQQKGGKRHGIYEHVGNTLHLCYGPASKPRPTKFEATPGSEYFEEVWKFECPLPEKKD